jgi:TM2 domain-containing membrane protein YozV
MTAMPANPDTHSKTIGYLLWIFGFMGAHRFYYGRQLTGTLWFFTLGLLFVGWIIDLFLIPAWTATPTAATWPAPRATTSAGCC